MPRRIAPHSDVRRTPAPSDRLRDLARQLARLNVSGRLDPEQIVGAKHAIVRGMDRLAAELDR
jgi:hypothetical protein